MLRSVANKPRSKQHARKMWHNCFPNLALFLLFLLCDCEKCVAISDSSSLNYSDYYYHSNYNASGKHLRFHDFEPRQQVARLVDEDEAHGGGSGREARGFHFNANGEDINVELEFIVPFVRVPVRRSMKLAGDAVMSVLNLQKGALLNTAVIVVTGAIIAGLVRLVLAPIVFTSMVNNYAGYQAKDYNEPLKSSSRSVRSLTEVLESQLQEHNIDVSVCAQRAICQYLQHNAAQLQRPDAVLSFPNTAKVINLLANSRWTDSLLNGTAVFRAIDVARNSRNSCNHIYGSCSWPLLQGGSFYKSWPNLLKYFNGRLFV